MTGARVHGLPPGVDFPAALARGLRSRWPDPAALAGVTLWVNSAGMRRRVLAALAAQGAVLLPRVHLVTELAEAIPHPGLPQAEPPLRRRLQLAQMIAALIARDPGLAPRSALFDLAESLAALMDEMAGEGVAPQALAALDVSDHSAHWARTQAFLGIAAEYLGPALTRDSEGRRRILAEALPDIWARTPPQGPQIVAGSTGSRGATALLMQAVAALPQGHLVLPGFDFDLPAPVWAALDDALTAEDHPQYRYRLLLDRLALTLGDVAPWDNTPAPNPARNALVSLALRPAPVTDQWITEGAQLRDLPRACDGLTLIEAPSPRAEALAIALVLREALARGQAAALMTPDRDLARRVAAALDRWGITPDDSAGRPLGLSPPGRLLRQVAGLMGARVASDQVMALLKHPLVHAGAGRGDHLRLTRELELTLRRKGPAFPGPEMLRAFGASLPEGTAWGGWLAAVMAVFDVPANDDLETHVHRHIALTEALVAGSAGGDATELWAEAAGQGARALVDAVQAEAGHGGPMSPGDYAALLDQLMSGAQVRDSVAAHADVQIWGSREARENHAPLLVMGGLTDGTWPALPPPDPWLNRQMRVKAGLLLPERRIGLAAHDFQQAIAAPCVVLSRAKRNDEAETTPSRWLNRLLNLVQGLPDQGGDTALKAMRARGQHWLDMAARLDVPDMVQDPAPRPAPAPPVARRPAELPVTSIETLIRDPYAIYARYVLRLRALDPLRQAPDARLRGSVLHKIMEAHARGAPHANPRAALETAARQVLAAQVPWPAARALWLQRLMRVADWFIAFEAKAGGQPVVMEQAGAMTLPALGFTLTARPDRIDRLSGGGLHLFDYKTGTPPTPDQQRYYDKQLLLTAAIVAHGGFRGLEPPEVAGASYVGLGATPKVETVDVSSGALDLAMAELADLIAHWRRPERGYPSRRSKFKVRFEGEYDHLARHGEWDDSAVPLVIPVGDHGDG
jgi:ATP-dependent helicase/nuclease subunit B